MKKVFVILALFVPALLGLGVMLGLIVLVLQSAPPFVSTVALVVFALVVCWFLFVRRRGNNTVVSESSLLGRQSSKEGLL
jgi:membrane protein implicated in regulation of membrane protease activity